MLAELNWEPLASRRRAARLVFFYKVHYELVAVNMPLELKHHPRPTRTENSLAYYIRQHQWIIKRTHSSSAQLETGTISQKKLYSHPLLNPSGATSHHKLPPGYSTSTGERESRPFREEPWHLHLHYVSSLSMHSMHSALPTCQPPFMVRSLQLVEVRPYAEEEERAAVRLVAGATRAKRQ